MERAYRAKREPEIDTRSSEKGILKLYCSSFILFTLLLWAWALPVGRANETPKDLTEMPIEGLMNLTIETISKFQQRVIDSLLS